MNYEEQNFELINSFLDMQFFNSNKPITIELFITADCNLNCSYCYLQEQKEGLYPKELRDMKNIVKNTERFFDFLNTKKCEVYLNIFSGEFFNLMEDIKILNIIYDYIINPNSTSKILAIIIPSNMSFIQDSNSTYWVQTQIHRFREIGVPIIISASIDGKYLESKNRQFNAKILDNRDDEYYHNLFYFIKKNKFGLHPMVASKGIENWIDNYKWFMKMCEKYELRPPMMLEVRDDNWRDEDISNLIKLLDYEIDYEFENIHNSDIKGFMKRVFIKPKNEYDNISLLYRGNHNTISCMIQNALYIRMGDLAIVPCHRLSYDSFNYGKIVFKNNSPQIEPGNIPMMLQIYSMNASLSPKCENCEIRNFCIKGCLGSQYEISSEPFIPNETVCKMYKNKIRFLLHKYHKMGIIEEFLNIEGMQDIKIEIANIGRMYGLWKL